MALAALLGFATIGSGLGLMTTSAYIIAKAALRPSIADLQVAIVGVRFFGIARGLFRYLERYVSHHLTFRLLARLRVWFYEALEPLAPARLMQYRSGDLLARTVADVETLQDFYLRVIAPPVVAVLVALLAAAVTGIFDARLAALLLAFLVLAGVGLPLLTRAMSRSAGRRSVKVRSELSSVLVDGVQGVADLLVSDGGERYLTRVQRLSRESGQLQARLARIGAMNGALSGLLMNLATVAVLAVAIPLVSSARMDGVFLAMLALAVMSSFEAVQPLPQAFQTLGASLESAQRLFEILDAGPASMGTAASISLPSPVAPLVGGPTGIDLQVRDLRFSYASGQVPVLDGISFDLPQGGCLALVGPSGVGKSTLVNLLLRFWDYQAGQILLGGRELRQISDEDLRPLMAVVSQRTHLFNTTVRENLLLACPGASESRMVEAARQAQIHDFIESLPMGYDTSIGEQGLKLSGGQRQRLAIARAILRDAPLLILDEPTANLDALTERAIVSALENLMPGRTTLIITHRLAIVEAADEILVLRAGRIVERGNHPDLAQMGGFYRHMWDLQNQVLAANWPEGQAWKAKQRASKQPL
jgi:ATP-binding cassette subfamily C protein CydC